jgi:hypothetical protein
MRSAMKRKGLRGGKGALNREGAIDQELLIRSY